MLPLFLRSSECVFVRRTSASSNLPTRMYMCIIYIYSIHIYIPTCSYLCNPPPPAVLPCRRVSMYIYVYITHEWVLYDIKYIIILLFYIRFIIIIIILYCVAYARIGTQKTLVIRRRRSRIHNSVILLCVRAWACVTFSSNPCTSAPARIQSDSPADRRCGANRGVCTESSRGRFPTGAPYELARSRGDIGS